MFVAKRFVLAISLILIIGCSHSIVTTQPNTTYLYNIPTIAQFLPHGQTGTIKKTATSQQERVVQLFEKIFKFDQELAIELGRIPEFQEGINKSKILALEAFVEFLTSSTDNEKRAIREILNVGKPKYRKFCSPLQGLFWLGEKGELSKEKNPLQNYSLEKLLDQAWEFETQYTKEEAINIINNVKNKDYSQTVLNESKDDMKKLNHYANVLKKYYVRKEFFEFEDKSIFKKHKGIDKWNDFKVVVDRLNSPELIDYYEKKNFCYDFDRLGWVLRGPREIEYDMHYLFNNKRGVCTDFAAFTHYCLVRSGYGATIYKIRSPGGIGGAQWHVFVVFRNNGKRYALDNGMGLPHGIYELKEPLVFYSQ